MAGHSSTQPGSKLDWMYQGPGGHVSREEYLLGRKVDASLDLLNNENKDKVPPKTTNQIEYDIIPESIARRRPEETSVVQVDMKRKLLEDPLLAIRKREELTRREITSNPVKRKQLELLVRSIQNLGSSSSSDSDSDDSSKKKKHKKQKRKHRKHKSDKSLKRPKNKSKTKKVHSPVQNNLNKHSNHDKRSPDVRHHKKITRDSSQYREKLYKESYNKTRHESNCEEKRHRDMSSHDSNRSFKHQSHIPDRKDSKSNYPNVAYRSRRKRSRSPYERDPPRKANKLSQADMDRKRQEMMQSAVLRDQQRRENVKRYDEERRREERDY